MSRTIAIVEDEAALRDNYAEILSRRGYRVNSYADRDSAMQAFRARLPDLAILDITLGEDIDAGFEMCRELRGLAAGLPIVFLTARDSDFDAIAGLRLGADDYLTKDVSVPHILARVAALFRRVEALSASQHKADVQRVGPLELDRERLQVRWRDAAVELTLTEFWLVNALARRPGHVKNRDQLMEEASVVVDDATITSHIKRIRRKFRAVDEEFDGIDTVYGLGYRWRA